jgi:hypothetical protein
MSNKKLPLPIIKLEEVMPKDKDDCKCAPHLTFDNGSCMSLNILIKLANAFNSHCEEESNNKNLIKIFDGLELLHPDEYKRYLLFEMGKRFKGSQHDWIKHKCTQFMNEDEKEELENNTFRPDGPQGKFEWLSTFDINFALAQYETKYDDFQFLGAVPIDFAELDNLPFKKLNFNDLYSNGKKRIGVVFNLDEHYKGGSHWVSLFADLEKGQVYFSDSYAIPPEKRIVAFMRIIEEYLKNEKNISEPDIRYNKMQHQRGNSECGVYSINFILRLLKGKSFDYITRKRVSDEKVNKCRMIYFK